MVATRGPPTSAAPTSPSPGSSASAPGGTPPAQRLHERSAQPGVCSAGLRTTVLPVTSAAAVMPEGMASGKFQGEMTAVTPRAPSAAVALAGHLRERRRPVELIAPRA